MEPAVLVIVRSSREYSFPTDGIPTSAEAFPYIEYSERRLLEDGEEPR